MARPQRLRDKTGPSWHGAWATEEGNLRVISLSLLKMNALLRSWQPRVTLPQPAELGATLQPQGCPVRDRQHEMEEPRLCHTVTVPWHVTLTASRPSRSGSGRSRAQDAAPSRGAVPQHAEPSPNLPAHIQALSTKHLPGSRPHTAVPQPFGRAAPAVFPPQEPLCSV